MRPRAHAGLRRAATGRAPPALLPGGTRPAAAAAVAPLFPRPRARALRCTFRSAARAPAPRARAPACGARRRPQGRRAPALAVPPPPFTAAPPARPPCILPQPRGRPSGSCARSSQPFGPSPHRPGLSRRLRAAGAVPAATRARAHSAPCSRSPPPFLLNVLFTLGSIALEVRFGGSKLGGIVLRRLERLCARVCPPARNEPHPRDQESPLLPLGWRDVCLLFHIPPPYAGAARSAAVVRGGATRGFAPSRGV